MSDDKAPQDQADVVNDKPEMTEKPEVVEEAAPNGAEVEDKPDDEAAPGRPRKPSKEGITAPTNPFTGTKAPKWEIAPFDSLRYLDIDLHCEDPSVVSKAVLNKDYNRYLDVLPNPFTRVQLPEIEGDPTTS